MTVDTSKVRVAVAGEIFVGPTASAAPTTTGSATTGFVGLGGVTEEGLVEARGRDTEDITLWANATIARTVVTGATFTYNFRLAETKKEVIELVYGTTVTTGATEGSFLVIPSSTGGRKSFIIDVIDGAELRRTYIPQGEVSEVGDVTYASGEPISYEVTITAYLDATLGAPAKVFATALMT